MSDLNYSELDFPEDEDDELEDHDDGFEDSEEDDEARDFLDSWVPPWDPSHDQAHKARSNAYNERALQAKPATKIYSVHGFTWSETKSQVAAMLASGYDEAEIKRRTGAKVKDIRAWLSHPNFAAEVDRLALMTGVALRSYRIRLANRIIRQIGIRTNKDLLDWLKYLQSETTGAVGAAPNPADQEKLFEALAYALSQSTGGDFIDGDATDLGTAPTVDENDPQVARSRHLGSDEEADEDEGRDASTPMGFDPSAFPGS